MNEVYSSEFNSSEFPGTENVAAGTENAAAGTENTAAGTENAAAGTGNLAAAGNIFAPGAASNVVELCNVTVKFDDDIILDNLSLSIKDKEFVTLLGPSGCGKTTTLRLIAGFLEPNSGEILFNGVDVKSVPTHKRPVNTIFQKYALFPHLNVYDNIAFGLKVARVPKKEIALRVYEMLELVNLKGFEKRPVQKLSGGQQQRVAIARAAINNPKVLLLDEPLAALDAKLRKDMQNELKSMQRRLGITFVFVTHDQEEALSMSDTVVVMDGGKIQQIGSPVDIYNEPRNAFVADFIGESNIIDGVMIKDRLVKFHNRKLVCVDEGFEPFEPVDVVIRPEDVDIVHPEKGLICGTVTSVTFKGVHYEIIIDVDGFKWMVQTTDESRVGDFVGLSIDPDAIHVMKKSEYSGTMGDYSYFSDEMEEIDNPDVVIEEGDDEKID
ncbi:MAG: polyamine ABC transporter ATP-binding protein [Clostridia bacterium]|nr:polyamine ABC transporter ATP-binding protein [Clostridia bacterium]